MEQGKSVWRLIVTSEFSASHQLRNYGGKCENLHGHNFTVEAALEGTELHPRTGILMDFKELKAALRSVLETLDHKHLNEVEPFDTCNPSSELLAQFIFRRLSPLVERSGITLRTVSVSEKESSKAVYMEER
jgi:6-pyruvoyltetrahydropterin/6-carboxytetrahydropterin synthase